MRDAAEVAASAVAAAVAAAGEVQAAATAVTETDERAEARVIAVWEQGPEDPKVPQG